jgi:ABC-2 type transport system ATP-binding protein
MTQLLAIDSLLKKYDSGFVFGPSSWSVNATSVAVFGKNGSGKSTFFQLLTGNLDRTSGCVWIEGNKMSPDAVDLKRQVGYLPQESHLPDWVTPNEVLTWCAKLHGVAEEAKEHQLQLWDISGYKHRPLALCSHGMRKRVGLAAASMHRPKVLVLDEAFNALDIIHTKTLEQLIRQRTSSNLLTLVSTHSPIMAADLCERAILITAGRLEELLEWPSLSVLERKELIDRKFFS